jgi:cytochrome c oxidase cbb3-type subunit 3
MWWRSLLAVSIIMIVTGLAFSLWEKRGYNTSPAADASQSNFIKLSDVSAGGGNPVVLAKPDAPTHEEISSYDVNEGKRLYHWFNCHTCHANGGGDIGPALMDEKWLYGSEPRNIFATILEGRPNGMPSFRGKIPDAQVWQIVAYVRSMSGHVPLYARPSRNDDIQAKKPESMVKKQDVHDVGSPSPDRRSNIR